MQQTGKTVALFANFVINRVSFGR